MRKINLTLLFIVLFSAVRAQLCTNLGQTPLSAFPVCGTTTFKQLDVPSCNNGITNVRCGNGGFEAVNPFYYKFKCYTAGTLGFIIQPINALDDYDWVLYDVTNRDPALINNNPTWVVTENWSGRTGNTGAGPTGSGLTNCGGGSYPTMGAMPGLRAGNDYLLLISNFSHSQKGYDLSFTGGTAVITDPLTPNVSSAIASCDGTQVTVRFNKQVKCNSLAADGSDFIINGATIINATGFNCTNSFDMDSALITLSAPLNPGTYIIGVTWGNDGNTITDNCDTEIPTTASANFTVAARPDIMMGSIMPPSCVPNTITLQLTEPVHCNSIAANGSDFTVTGPSAVMVTGATGTCDINGFTTTVTIQLSAPITVSGNYSVAINNGTDGNTIIGNCGRILTQGGNTGFTIIPQTAINMGTVLQPACLPRSITLNFPDPILCSSIAANGTDFTIAGPSPVVVTGTSFNCNAQGFVNAISLQLNDAITIPGNYTVTVSNGTDGNVLIGECGRLLPDLSTATFNIPVLPAIPMGTINSTACAPGNLVLNFSEKINCSSIDLQDFVVSGPAPVTITNVNSTCDQNNQTDAITITFAAPVNINGNYQLILAPGGILTGDCNKVVTAGATAAFTVPDIPFTPMDSLAPVGCAPNQLRLVFKEAILCSSIAADGSDFTLTGNNAPAITSVQGCNGATTREIILQLASPIQRAGNYTVALTTGTDGNTIWNNCYRSTPAGATLAFVTSDTVSAEFTYSTSLGCDNNVTTFTHDGNNNVTSWRWQVNGSAAANTASFSRSFSASSQNTITLTVNNTLCTDTYSIPLHFNNKVMADFTVDAEACPEDSIRFINNSSGPIETWQWNFGNGHSSNIKTPLPILYAITEREQLYNISLTVSNGNGCSMVTTKKIKIFSNCFIAVPTAFTPNGDNLNDYLYPLNAFKADNLDFKVFNRWGQLLFHSTNWLHKWDGKVKGIEQGAGIYVWQLSYIHRDTREQVVQKGTTVLIK
jgi:gliding motility-associated-like protein